MRVACPSCSTSYEIPADRLAAGKSVRCARCGASWAPIPLDVGADETPTEPRIEPAPDPNQLGPNQLGPNQPDPNPVQAEPPKPMAMESGASARPNTRLLLAAWIGSGVVLIVAVCAIVVWRKDLTRFWPPLGRLYEVFG